METATSGFCLFRCEDGKVKAWKPQNTFKYHRSWFETSKRRRVEVSHGGGILLAWGFFGKRSLPWEIWQCCRFMSALRDIVEIQHTFDIDHILIQPVLYYLLISGVVREISLEISFCFLLMVNLMDFWFHKLPTLIRAHWIRVAVRLRV